jgi:riboflavin kinase/FMN adenylyltransferase
MTVITENNRIIEKTAVVLGIFDGVHLGHRKIIETALEYCQGGLAPAVFTFQAEGIGRKHGKEFEFIYTDRQKAQILESLGEKYICSPEIKDIQQMSGEDFTLHILREKMNAHAVVCGENFRFGKDASNGAKELKEYGKKFGFEVSVCGLVSLNGHEISSGYIRELLKNGDVEFAGKLLGENYFIDSAVVTGNRIGRTIDFPTINQEFKNNQLILRKGVYGSTTYVNGKKYLSVTNIGVKPTVEKDIRPLAETNIIGFEGDLYGKTVRVELLNFVRDEQKFDSVEQLKKRINADVQNVKEMYGGK